VKQPKQLQDYDGPKKTYGPPDEYDPLRDCPPEDRHRYVKLEAEAKKMSWPAMRKLHCLDCCGWYIAEVRTCTLNHCAFWPKARKDLLVEVQQNVPRGTG